MLYNFEKIFEISNVSRSHSNADMSQQAESALLIFGVQFWPMSDNNRTLKSKNPNLTKFLKFLSPKLVLFSTSRFLNP